MFNAIIPYTAPVDVYMYVASLFVPVWLSQTNAPMVRNTDICLSLVCLPVLFCLKTIFIIDYRTNRGM